MLRGREARDRVKLLVAGRAAARPDPKLCELRSQERIAEQLHMAPRDRTRPSCALPGPRG
jgi:hypothetical protein